MSLAASMSIRWLECPEVWNLRGPFVGGLSYRHFWVAMSIMQVRGRVRTTYFSIERLDEVQAKYSIRLPGNYRLLFSP
jgi:hypothetical protein